MRKITALSFCLLLSFSTVQAFEGGSGTSSDPYQIATCQQLQDMQNDLDANYEIIENVDCSGVDFDPIGSSSSTFTGSLNGNPGDVRTVGYTISDLEIDSSSETGLFGATSGQISNFYIEGANVEGSGSVGVLSGTQGGGSITDIRVEESQLTATGSDIGGLVGNQNSGTISFSYADVDLDVGSANDHIGGFVGFANGGGNNNKAVGSISSGGTFVGGFVGRNSGVDQTQSFAAVNLGDPQNQHGFGPAIDGTGGTFSDLSTSYFDNTTSDLDDTDAQAGSDYARGLPTSKVTGESAETEMTQFNFGQEWASANQYPIIARHHFESGSGTEADPYEITTCRQLQNIQKSLHNHYEITENVDCSGVDFDPIGNSTEGFTGSLDGNHFSIRNLKIIGENGENIGLLARNDGTVTGVEIRGANMTSPGGNDVNAGILVGDNRGTINESMTSGIIIVSASGAETGGLVGFHQSGGLINTSYSVASVDGGVQGGLVGRTSGGSTLIEKSYAAGWVTTDGFPAGGGGVIGDLIDSPAREVYGASELENPDPDSSDGGVAGVQRFGGSVTDAYYDQNITGLDGDDGSSSIGGTANPGVNLTTSKMTSTAVSDMSGFDFTDTWESTSFYYPKLSWQETGSGTASDPYMIEDCRQLQAMQNDLNARYKLANDIDCSMVEYWNDGKGFYPVGLEANRFTGVLNGDGHVIHDLYIDRPSNPDETGLFGYVDSNGITNRIRKVGLENVDITGGNNDVGGLIGQNDHNIETIRKSFVTGNISGGGPMGALIGTNFGQVLDSYARANVTGSGSRVGGLVGLDSLDPVTRSYFTGTVQGNPVVGNRVFDPPSDTAYWDEDITGIQSNPSDHGAEPLRTFEMTDRRAIEYMDGFNFSTTWVARDNDQYPVLDVFTDVSGFSPGVDQPPGLPVLLNPTDNEQATSITPNLSAELFHPQGEEMDVDFIRSNGSTVGTDSGGSLDTVNYTWNGRAPGQSYNWSLIIEDSTGQTVNLTRWIDEWSFTTLHTPDRPSNPDPFIGEGGVEVDSNLTAFTSQEDGLNLFSDLYLTENSSVTRDEFNLAASDSVSGSGDAEFNPTPLENASNYRWYVNSSVTDENGNTLSNVSPIWNFETYNTPRPVEVMPDGATGLDPHPDLNVSVQHPQNLTVSFYDFQSHDKLGEARIEDNDWANISTASFDEYDKSQTHFWYVKVETDAGEVFTNNNTQDVYNFTVSDLDGVNFNILTDNNTNLDPGTADLGTELLKAEVSTPRGVNMDRIAFNVTDGSNHEIIGNSFDVNSGDTVTANLSEASIISEDSDYSMNVVYFEGGFVPYESERRNFTTHVVQLDWLPKADNYDGGKRGQIGVYYSSSDTSFSNFTDSGQVKYSKVNDTDSMKVANSKIDSGDQGCYELTVINAISETRPEGDCVGGIP